MRHLLWFCALAALAFPACKSASVRVPGPPHINYQSDCDNLALRLDRGAWMENQGTRIWKVLAAGAPNRPPRHIGYLDERTYQQVRGGPQFRMYTVTTLDRNEQIGHIDQLGKGVRYEPRRNGTFEQVPVGSNTREQNVQAIFDTKEAVMFVATSQRRLAFDSIDASRDGVLQPAETQTLGARITGADTNGDGVVDFEEFNAVDIL
jgi:hypothetical protein